MVEVGSNDEVMDDEQPDSGNPKKPKVDFRGKGKACTVWIEGLGLVEDFMASDDLNECVEALL